MSSPDRSNEMVRPGGLAPHGADLIAFFFELGFLVCTALAVGVRTASLGFGAAPLDGAWFAGGLLALVGLVGIIGTLGSFGRRRSSALAGEIDADESQVLDPPEAVEE